MSTKMSTVGTTIYCFDPNLDSRQTKTTILSLCDVI